MTMTSPNGLSPVTTLCRTFGHSLLALALA
ncbi:MAG: hypothetical protein ACJAYH_002596, partial [Celeribacter sp.]